jgi:hypothetical protein
MTNMTPEEIDRAFGIEPSAPPRDAAAMMAEFQAYLQAKGTKISGCAKKLSKALKKASAHEGAATATAAVHQWWNDPQFKAEAKVLVKEIQSRQAAEFKAKESVVAARQADDHFRRKMQIFFEEGGKLKDEYAHEWDEEISGEKNTLFNRMTRKGLVDVINLDHQALKVAKVIDDWSEQYEWLRVIVGGAEISRDARLIRECSKDIETALGGSVIDLKEKISQEIYFVYDKKKSEAENKQAYDKAKKELKEWRRKLGVEPDKEIAPLLADYYNRYIAVIKGVGDHVKMKMDEEGMKAWATTLGTSKRDMAVTGVDYLLEGLTGAIQEVPFPGAGSVAATVRAVISGIASKLHKIVRDCRIAEAKEKLAKGQDPNAKKGKSAPRTDPKKAAMIKSSPKVMASMAREMYLKALSEDASLMAARVNQIQGENIDVVINLLQIPMSEIPVPGVQTSVTSFLKSISKGYYELRLENLKEKLKKEESLKKKAEEAFKEWVVETGREAVIDAAMTRFEGLIQDLTGTLVRACRGAVDKLRQLVEWLKDAAKDAGAIAEDIGKDALIGLTSALLAKLAVKFLAQMGRGPVAEAVTGSDFKKMFKDLDDFSFELDFALGDGKVTATP